MSEAEELVSLLREESGMLTKLVMVEDVDIEVVSWSMCVGTEPCVNGGVVLEVGTPELTAIGRFFAVVLCTPERLLAPVVLMRNSTF